MLNINAMLSKMLENMKVNGTQDTSSANFDPSNWEVKFDESIFDFSQIKKSDSDMGLKVSQKPENVDMNVYYENARQAMIQAKSQLTHLQQTEYPTEQDRIAETESRIAIIKMAYDLEQFAEKTTGEQKEKLSKLAGELKQFVATQEATVQAIPIKTHGRDDSDLYYEVIGDDKVAFAKYNNLVARAENANDSNEIESLKNEIKQEKAKYDELYPKMKASEDLKEIIKTRATGLGQSLSKLEEKTKDKEVENK